MNPPYGHQRNKMMWINSFINNGNGIALLPDRTSAPWWQYFAKRSCVHLQIDGKIKFIKPDGSTGDQPGTGTTLFAIGEKGIAALIKAEQNKLGIVFKKAA